MYNISSGDNGFMLSFVIAAVIWIHISVYYNC